MAAIIGNQNPKVGETNFYEVSIFGALPYYNPNSTYEWYLFKKQKNGNWIDITKNGIPKIGTKVDYTFFEPVAGDLFEIRIFEIRQTLLPTTQNTKTFYGKLEITPTASIKEQINKVVLFNRGKVDVNKADYRDTLIAQAFCTGLFGKEIEFQLWEDDALGDGHNPEINKSNRIPRVYNATVNEKGIAEAKIPLSADEKVMRQIANKYLMKGDEDEGATHEFYVTATHLGKGEKASQINVNVANPDYRPKPKQNSAKFPATIASKTKKQPDPKGKITDAYFVDANEKKLTKVEVGNKIRVRINSQNLKGKSIQYVIWEYDNLSTNDEVYRSGKIRVDHDAIVTMGFTLTESIFSKGTSGIWGDSDNEKQNYFIEVIVLDVSAESKKFGIDSDGLMTVEKLKSPAVINKKDKKDTIGNCICQEQYKDLIWGGKVSCQFRKKVVQICTELWGEDRKMEMSNGLMAVMNVETAGSFKAHQIMGKSLQDVNSITKDDFWLYKKDKTGKIISKGSRAVGLIQFTQSALQAIGEFKSGTGFDKLHELKLKLAKMGEVNQLDYVKKYFEDSKSKIKSPEDIYLHVFAPKGVGKADNFVLYESGTEEYRQNASVDTKSTGIYKDDKKIQRSEILERYYHSLKEGQNNKPLEFKCSSSETAPVSKSPATPKEDMLSVHLSLAQAIRSDTAKQNGLDNTPSAAEKENLKQLGINIYDKIYDQFNGNVKLTSVFRSEAVNKKVGGSNTSQHRFGQALDIQGTNGITNKQIFKYVRHNLSYHQIIWEYGSKNEPDWVHVGYKPSGNKKINTRAVRIKGKTNYITFDLEI
ncbi:D-Ala-D-Ala carboxypeptidase family metallohydrolase [Chryseobacterium sp. KACC 21268]|nr:D-Ala-D-Ala carboxypeptidase family metallohydrolase [Chryseobacterium sp. KACC 21268]